MRKPEHPTEPSIEEILASIRSIIAEDGAPSRSAVKPVNESAARRSGREQENVQNTDRPASTLRQDNPAFTQALKAPNTADGGEEILELTEDFMLAEPATPQSGSSSDRRLASRPLKDFHSGDAAGDFRPGPSPEEEELDEVLSNLAAEVERLAAPEAVQKRSYEPDAGKTDERQDRPESGVTSSFGAPEFVEPDEQPVGQPQIAGIAEPKATTVPAGSPPAAQTPPSAPASVAKSKLVWSARRLEKSAPPRAPGAEAPLVEEQPSPPDPPQEPPTKLSSPVSRRDLWAEGVQMPVPDTGPEMPLPLSDGESRNMATDAGASRKEKSADEDDRRAVGSFLTRVFASTPAEQPEETAADETSLRGKAEKLARDTISDFAEEKLNAPAVGNALKADKDFMNEVAASLESALASSEETNTPDLPEHASQSGAEEELSILSAKDSGLDIKLKEALEADAQISEAAATGEKQQDAAPAVETSAAPADSIARDEAPGSEPAETAQTDLPEEGAPQSPPEPRAAATSQADKPDMPGPALNLPGSLEGSIKEMIKPLIIQWLNENLPRIVEEAVREELTGRNATGGQKDRSRA